MVVASKLIMQKESTDAKCANFLERENAKMKFPKSGKCECNWYYTHLSSFLYSRLVDATLSEPERHLVSQRGSLSGPACLADVSNSKSVFFNTQTWLSARIRLLSEVYRSEKW